MKIVQKHLSPGNYFAQAFRKTNIVLHHTVSSTAQSALSWWESQPSRIGTAYVIDKNGTIYEAFPPQFWAHHLGLNARNNTQLNRQSIGIEFVNEGPIFNSEGQFRWLKFDGPAYNGKPYRSVFRNWPMWAEYTNEQILAGVELVAMLCQQHKIPPTIARMGVFDPSVPDNFGIYAHHNVRADKTDVSPAFPIIQFRAFLAQRVGPFTT